MSKARLEALRAVREPILDELGRMEQMLSDALESNVTLIRDVCSYLRGIPGKRVRPTLLLLMYKLNGGRGGPEAERSIIAATAIELIHTATLVHDDVIDNCHVRRGAPTVNARWGNEVSLMIGDYLYSKALDLAVEAGVPMLLPTLARATHLMSRGELFEHSSSNQLDLSEEEYMTVISEKTGCLFAAACEIGAVTATGDGDVGRAFARLGRDVGLAFQIMDDVRDFVSTEAAMGKPSGNDLLHGRVTLPLILSLRNAPTGTRVRMEDLITSREAFNGRWDEVVSFVSEFGGIEYCRKTAHNLAASARSTLEKCEASQSRDALVLAVDYLSGQLQ